MSFAQKNAWFWNMEIPKNTFEIPWIVCRAKTPTEQTSRKILDSDPQITTAIFWKTGGTPWSLDWLSDALKKTYFPESQHFAV